MKSAIRRRLRPTAYTVGISVFINPNEEGGYAFFSNGLRQNVLLLYQLFKNSRNCERVYLLNEGTGETPTLPDGLGGDKIRVAKTRDVVDDLDVLLVVGAAVPRELMLKVRANGGKVINYKGGNGGIISIESIIGTPTKGVEETYFDHDCYDQVWLTPQHMHTYAGWCRTIYRCPVHEIPQVWSPLFLNSMEPHIQQLYGYKPGKAQWRLGVMDPNITVMKTLHMPMLVCEAAYKRNKKSISNIYITNAIQYMDNKHLQLFSHSLDIQKDRIVTMEQRWVSWLFLATYCDMVVTHHWENGLNYLYWDVLYGNYPLIHNSEFIKGYGYYYNSFDAGDGARAVADAIANHDDNLPDYTRRSQAMLAEMNPSSPRLIIKHENLIMNRVSAL